VNKKESQAHKQAPWRVQIRSVGLFLLALAAVAVIAGLYLSVSAQAASAGLEIRALEAERANLAQLIADQEVHLAWLNSSTHMTQRARELGFSRISADQAVYVVVPGYLGRPIAHISRLPGIDVASQDVITPKFTQSLWDYLFEGIGLGN